MLHNQQEHTMTYQPDCTLSPALLEQLATDGLEGFCCGYVGKWSEEHFTSGIWM